MLHTKRRWCVADVADVNDVAERLTSTTWVLCNGIRWRHLLILNDATNEDGAQEYAVVDEKTGYQLETLTCSWMTPARLAATLQELASGAWKGEPLWPGAPAGVE